MSKNNIQYFREKKQYTQEQMAEKLEMPISTYGKIERGEINIVHKHLKNIANILEVEIYQLLPDHNIKHFENNKIIDENNLNIVLFEIQNNQQQLIENQKLLLNLLQEIILKNNGKAD